jgi:hypothetical protein
MYTPEQKARLTPEQLIIAERWEQESKDLGAIVEKMSRAMEERNEELWAEAQEDLQKPRPSQCEHGRHIMLSCAGCDEIERLLNPEFYDENGDRLDEETIEKLINEREARELKE